MAGARISPGFIFIINYIATTHTLRTRLADGDFLFLSVRDLSGLLHLISRSYTILSLSRCTIKMDMQWSPKKSFRLETDSHIITTTYQPSHIDFALTDKLTDRTTTAVYYDSTLPPNLREEC